MHALRRLIYASSLATGLVALPSTAVAEDAPSVWGGLAMPIGLDAAAPGLRGWFDFQVRRGQGGTQFLVRPGLGYQPVPWMSVWAGYLYVPTVFDDPEVPTLTEHRAWEQLLFHGDVHPAVRLVSRSRFEHRFWASDPGVGHRYRQLVRMNWNPAPLGPVGFVLFDEVFVGMNDADAGQARGFDQNRAFGGLSFKIGGLARVEAGYQNNVLLRSGALRVDHVIAAGLFISPKTKRRTAGDVDDVARVEPALQESVMTEIDLTMPNALHPSAEVWSGGQPTAGDLERLRAAGVTTVIDLRGEGEDRGFDERMIVEGLGLTYVAIPVPGAAGITEDNAKRLDAALDRADAGVLVHCASGNRVGGLFALRAKLHGADATMALEAGRDHGLTGLTAHVAAMVQ